MTPSFKFCSRNCFGIQSRDARTPSTFCTPLLLRLEVSATAATRFSPQTEAPMKPKRLPYLATKSLLDTCFLPNPCAPSSNPATAGLPSASAISTALLFTSSKLLEEEQKKVRI
ncbi:hypothetical protein Mapa_007913 [Marchantia paleacea]|nr:hypothetical protein Mapa_007913 [Marchantia paleacea]